MGQNGPIDPGSGGAGRGMAARVSHYEVLGVDEEASAEQVKRAYYRRARRLHPDAHAGSGSAVVAEAARAMAELNEAWTVLRDAGSRARYDAGLREPVPAAAGAKGRGRGRDGVGSPPPLVMGAGFRYWMGQMGALPGDDGRTRLNLTVEGDTDLAPLGNLETDRLWGLHCERSGVDDDQLAHLENLASLRLLDLSGTRVGDEGLVHLRRLDRLESLYLWDTAVSDEGLVSLGLLTSLRLVGLGNTAVTDAGLAHLRSLRGLRVLQLWGTEVRGPGLVNLHGLPELEIVTLPRRVGFRHRRRLKDALRPGALIG